MINSATSQTLLALGTKLFCITFIASIALYLLGNYSASRRDFNSSDLIAYKIAHTLASQGLNPYDPGSVRKAWGENYGDPGPTPMMIWNPPTFFLFPGVLIALPGSFLYSIWPITCAISATLLGFIGWRLSGSTEFRASTFSIAAFLSTPLMIEFQRSQMSALLALAPLIGILFFLKRKDFIAGILFSLAILKPHVLFFPIAAVAFWVLFERRWITVVGVIFGLTIGFIGAELFSPGIFKMWIYRPSWPVDYVGSSLPSILRALFVQSGLPDFTNLPLIIPIMGVLGLWIYLLCRANTSASLPLIWTLLLNQFFTPYGFIFDQTVLIVVQAFLLFRLVGSPRYQVALFLLFLVNLMPIVVSAVLPASIKFLWWGVYPPLLILVFLLLGSTLRANHTDRS